MGKQCLSQAVLELGSWGHSVLQTPALVAIMFSGKLYFLENQEYYRDSYLAISWQKYATIGIHIFTTGFAQHTLRSTRTKFQV